MAGIKWTKEEDDRLIQLWRTESKSVIIENFNRSYASLIIRASLLGLKKKYTKHPYVKSNLEVLLEETPESLYWVGFLMADGCIQGKRIRLTISVKDTDHLLAFKTFCGIPTHFRTNNNVAVQAQNSLAVPEICSKYDMRERKTYRPTKYMPLEDDLFVSFLLGFIDGDGCVKKQSGNRKDSLIAIKLHSSWLKYLSKLNLRISQIVGVRPANTKINKKGYAIVNICNSIIIKYLKRKALELKLPVLKRKWDRVDLNYTSKHEKALINKEKS